MGLELERGGAEVAALAQELRVGECVLHDGGHVRRGVDHTHLARHRALGQQTYTITKLLFKCLSISIIQIVIAEFHLNISS